MLPFEAKNRAYEFVEYPKWVKVGDKDVLVQSRSEELAFVKPAEKAKPVEKPAAPVAEKAAPIVEDVKPEQAPSKFD